MQVFSEIFADRAYQPDGQLVPRGRPGAVLHDAEAVAQRLIGFLQDRRMPVEGGRPIELAADSVCVHGDTPGAALMARLLRARLDEAGVTVAPFLQG